MRIIAKANYHLLNKITNTGLKVINWQSRNFKDGEKQIFLTENFSDQVVTIIYDIFPDIGNSILELCFLTRLLKNKGAKDIQVIISYLSYSRQSKLDDLSFLPLETIGRMFEASGIKKLITIDIHCDRIKDFIFTDFLSLPPTDMVLPLITEDTILVSPDFGGAKRVGEIAKISGNPMVIMKKTRDSYGKVNVVMDDNVIGRDCYIIDDIIDSGNTILSAAKTLKNKGAKSVNVFCTHPVFSNLDLAKEIEKSDIEKMFVSNSIDSKNTIKNSTKISTIDITPILINYLKHEL